MINPDIYSIRAFWAKRAIQFVVEEKDIRSSNYWKSCLLLWRHFAIAGQRSTYPDVMNTSAIEQIATTSEATGFGNCMEKSAIAFDFLLKTKSKHLLPLHWCILDKLVGSHAFVIIGELNGSLKAADWSKDAVICDPWKEVFHTSSTWNRIQGNYDIYTLVTVENY